MYIDGVVLCGGDLVAGEDGDLLEELKPHQGLDDGHLELSVIDLPTASRHLYTQYISKASRFFKVSRLVRILTNYISILIQTLTLSSDFLF